MKRFERLRNVHFLSIFFTALIVSGCSAGKIGDLTSSKTPSSLCVGCGSIPTTTTLLPTTTSTTTTTLFSPTTTTQPVTGPAGLYTSVGQALYALGYTRAICFNFIVHDILGVFDPTKPMDPHGVGLVGTRFGFSDPSKCLGEFVGERFSASIVLPVIRHPSNPLNIVNNTSYGLNNGTAVSQLDQMDIVYSSRGDQQESYDEYFVPLYDQLHGPASVTLSFTNSNVRCSADVQHNSIDCNGVTGSSIGFSVDSPQGDVTYTWAFGDGATATGVQVAHSYKTGTFTATVSATNNGVPATASKVFIISEN